MSTREWGTEPVQDYEQDPDVEAWRDQMSKRGLRVEQLNAASVDSVRTLYAQLFPAPGYAKRSGSIPKVDLIWEILEHELPMGKLDHTLRKKGLL